MGYDKSKKWSDQTNQARENVSIVYNAMVQNAVSKPDMYGKFLTATLHVDEGTPHVDYMTTGVDAERPTWSMREVLNGKEWRDEDGKRRFPPKGSKLRALQDDLDTIFDEQAQMILDYIVAKHIPKKLIWLKILDRFLKSLTLNVIC